jgi:predicted PurR-regulated permease PerM
VDSPQVRKVRSTVIHGSGALLLFGLAVFLLWSLRAIVLPVLVGALAAYLCIPILDFFERKGAPRGVAIALVFAAFFLAVFVAVRELQSVIPNARERLELRIRVEYKTLDGAGRDAAQRQLGV